uniref:Dehydrogenase/reductase SDR family member 1-like n=1 Tax=Phallusia mammillata TaxID=59560 RepID=A0A6F9DA67_9ASCI|nr:dehydrogenase/reductase SDR family member 1-like [Phallusia mammillata]
MPNLRDMVCLVTGASRGVGKGTAMQLADNGATCYITGRSLDRLVSVQEEARENGLSGKVVPVQCDHANDREVEELFELIARENNGRLDLLVNNATAANAWAFEHSDECFWDQPLDSWDIMNRVGLRNNYLCAVHASRLMVKQRRGLIVNISSIAGVSVQTPVLSVCKVGLDRMAWDCAQDLKKYDVACISFWPGLVRTEMVQEAKDAFIARSKTFAWIYEHSESSQFTGRCISHLLVDPDLMKKTGKILLSSDVAADFNFKDVDGRSPVSMRSIKSIVGSGGSTGLAECIPECFKLPLWLFTSMATLVKQLPKQTSRYE